MDFEFLWEIKEHVCFHIKIPDKKYVIWASFVYLENNRAHLFSVFYKIEITKLFFLDH
jgi:hypothetical protein